MNKHLCFVIVCLPYLAFCQNINYERLDVKFLRYPLKPLDKSVKTYSSSIVQMGANLNRDQIDSLRRNIVIPGYQKISAGGDVVVELVISPLSIINKEVKDQPMETEKDGKKITTHQYWYEIKFAFPIKIKMVRQGETMNEQDLPGFFTREYTPQDRSSQNSLQREFDQDRNYLFELSYRKLDEAEQEIKNWLFSIYGQGMVSESISIAYVKDKKGEYADLTKAMSLMLRAYQYANNNKDYFDDSFKESLNEAISVYQKALLESSDDKKARIDEKVTAAVQYNVALAYYGLMNWEEADQWAAKVKKGNNVTIGFAHTLRDRIDDKRNRLIANGLLNGESKRVEPSVVETKKESTTSEKQYRDYVVRTAGDTLDVRFIVPSREVMPYGDSVWLQDKVAFTVGDKSRELLPQQLHSYSYKGVVRESVNWIKDFHTVPYLIEYKLCKRLVSGSISVYDCYEVVPSTRDPSVNLVRTNQWYKKDNLYESTGFLNFNKGVSKLVKDYPALSERVKNGEFNRKDFVKIVDEYNAWINGK